MKKEIVLSLFDGMGGGILSLNRAQIPIEIYYASEIDKYAMAVAKHRNPKIIHVGDVTKLNPEDFKHVTLVIGGSPCQSISVAGKIRGIATKDGIMIQDLDHYLQLKRQGKEFTSSALFWEFVRMYEGIKKYNPDVKFFLENVYNKHWGTYISNVIGVKGETINSSTVTAQNRLRTYWTNIPYTPIVDKGIKLKDIIPNAVAGAGFRGNPKKDWDINPVGCKHYSKLTVRKDGLANCLTAGGNTTSYYKDIFGNLPRITPEQAEMLQTVPIGYTKAPGVSNRQRLRMLGNGWTIDVIAEGFFKNLKI